MDPKIAAGFSILGNALMPDPGKMAQAEVYRSQMLENQANARKLGLEGDALQRAAENLARLQDVLSNPGSTARDIIVPGIAADITTNPTDIPKFALASEGLENLDFNDPASVSRALLTTGTVASQAATPQGFASDQARQVQANEADNQTAMRNADIAAATDRRNADVAATTDLAVQDKRGAVETEIADAQRRLTELMKTRELANQRLINAKDIEARTGDATARLKAEAIIADLDRQANIEDQNADRLAEDARKVLDIAGAEKRTVLETAGELDVAELGAETDLGIADKNAAARIESARIAAGGGGGAPKISQEAYEDFQQSTAKVLGRRQPGSFDTENMKVTGLNRSEWMELGLAAFEMYPDNAPARVDFVLGMLKFKNGKWRIDRKAMNAFAPPGEEDGTEAEAPADATTAPPPAYLNGREIVFEDGAWHYSDDGTPVEP